MIVNSAAERERERVCETMKFASVHGEVNVFRRGGKQHISFHGSKNVNFEHG